VKSLILLFLFGILIVGVALFFKGQSNAVNLYHICGKEVPWYDAMFLAELKDKAGCEKYQ
jgi:hypothetical protein